MKKTGKRNPITGEEILQAEIQDVNWGKEWDELTQEERVNFMSFEGIEFLSNENEQDVKELFELIRSFVEMQLKGWKYGNK